MHYCSANRSQRSSAITSIRLETERFSKEAICSGLFRCSSRTVRLSFALFLFFLDFAIRSFYPSFFIADHFVSRELAARFNTNNSPYDSAIDDRYITTHVGGSTLHHNLDGSHTFAGAMDALRRHFPGDSDFNLHLRSLEHLARDFTTPSGITHFSNLMISSRQRPRLKTSG